jgi:signal peptidase II
VAVGVMLATGKPFDKPFGKWILTLILAGAVGNLIDRFFLHFVTDMIQVLFVNFAVFIVADCCVVAGAFSWRCTSSFSGRSAHEFFDPHGGKIR